MPFFDGIVHLVRRPVLHQTIPGKLLAGVTAVTEATSDTARATAVAELFNFLEELPLVVSAWHRVNGVLFLQGFTYLTPAPTETGDVLLAPIVLVGGRESAERLAVRLTLCEILLRTVADMYHTQTPPYEQRNTNVQECWKSVYICIATLPLLKQALLQVGLHQTTAHTNQSEASVTARFPSFNTGQLRHHRTEVFMRCPVAGKKQAAPA